MDFAKSVSFKKKNYLFATLALLAIRRLRVQSDLLNGAAFEVLLLVVCTKGPIYKKSVDRSILLLLGDS